MTHSSKLHFLVSTFLSTMFDVGDLPVLTFRFCVLKGSVIKWPVKLYVRFFYIFYIFTKS